MTGVSYQQEELDIVERLTNNEVRLTIELEAKAKADEITDDANTDSLEEV